MSKIHKHYITREELDAYIGGGVVDVLDHASEHESGGDLIDPLTFSNEGLHILDTGGDHDLIIKPGTDLGADRILTLTTGDAARTITLSGNPTLNDWFDQAVKQASSPLFANLNLGATPLIRQSAGALTIQTDEAVNTDTVLAIKGKGTGYGKVKIYDEDDAEWLEMYSAGGKGFIHTAGTTPSALHLQRTVPADIFCWFGIDEGNPSFYIYGWHVTDPDYMLMKVEADGDALIQAENDLNLRAGGGDINLGDENLTTTGTIAATTLQGALHWDYITNEPTYYPPEYHAHVGKDIVSQHLVDLDDIEADDIFDVLPTAVIHGEGNYDWWGTWVTDAGAGCSAEIVVEAGDDKILKLTDGNAATRVGCELSTDVDHPMVIACIQFDIRQSTNTDEGHIYFRDTIGANQTYIQMSDIGQIKFWDGAALTNLQAYAANTWYTIRIYWDCVSAAVAVWVDNVWKIRKDLAALEFINNILIQTKVGDTGYELDINNLKIFNLTV